MCEQAQCVWSTGKEFVKETEDFCAPNKVTMDAQEFSQCIKNGTDYEDSYACQTRG